MVKQRMASADVAGEVSCLKQKIVGLRLANLYDLNAKVGQPAAAFTQDGKHSSCAVAEAQQGCEPLQTYVLKLAKSGSDGEKVFLLLESGARFHTVQASAAAGLTDRASLAVYIVDPSQHSTTMPQAIEV